MRRCTKLHSAVHAYNQPTKKQRQEGESRGQPQTVRSRPASLPETLSQNKQSKTTKPTRDGDVQTFSIPRRGAFGFKTIHLCLGVCFQSDAYQYLGLELGVFVTQQLVPFGSLDNEAESTRCLQGEALTMFFEVFTFPLQPSQYFFPPKKI